MIMDMIRPDSGEILIFDQKFSEEAKNRIGYLPEERGLYRKKSILDTMTYLASLKGVEKHKAANLAESLLASVNMHSHKHKKIEELSHGMGQIIQFLVTILHNPEILILDEPFNGLDPVNIKMVKDMIFDLKKQDKAIMLSTHRMNEVEELCDRVFMISKGRNVLYGSLSNIKAEYRNNSIYLEYDGILPDLDDAAVNRIDAHRAEIIPGTGTDNRKLLQKLTASDIVINKFEISTPSLNDIFIRVAGSDK